jgi:uncharacterized repeat protein (TIGR01451 family)
MRYGTWQTWLAVVALLVMGVTAGQAALVPANSIGDTVWYDTNMDGVHDDDEVGIAGITVILTGDLDGDGVVDVTQTKVTNSIGKYLFSNLRPGTYTVTVVPPTGLTQTFDYDGLDTPHSATTTMERGQYNIDLDFGYVDRCSLGDYVWYDVNGDGVQDETEPGLSGITVKLLNSGGEVIATTETDANGFYYFDWLAAGNYQVVVVPGNLPAGINNPTFDYDGVGTPHAAMVTLGAGETNYKVDFGYTAIGEVGDRVWHDANGNGVQDAGEAGLVGVTVALTDSAGTVIATTQTAADGLYLFTGLPAGNYIVSVEPGTLPSGLNTPTYDLDGTGTAHKAAFSLGVAESKLDVDFGYKTEATISISGTVYLDCDADGKLSGGEPGLAGVTITLKDSSNRIKATTQTDSDGSYSFTNLTPGTYSVVETDPVGYISTNAIPGKGGSKRNNNTIRVVANTPGIHYSKQNFLDTGNQPGVTLVKTGPATAYYGETITYTFTVTNSGNTCLYGGLTVKDPMLGGTIWHKTPVMPGQSFTFTKTYKIPNNAASKLKNTAEAVGSPPTGKNVTATSSWTTNVSSCNTGSYRTETQSSWGATPKNCNVACYLSYYFCSLYPSGVTIGKAPWNTIKFTSARAVEVFLPASGSSSTLSRSHVNPSRTEAGIFAGQVLALKINCDFSSAGIFRPGLSALKVKSGPLAGKTVAEVLDLANRALGGHTAGLPYSIATLNSVVTSINENYVNGTVNRGFLVP